MAQISVTVNGRPYQMGCDDGTEDHVRELAAFIDSHVQNLVREVGQVGEARLLLMAAMLVSDELATSSAERDEMKTELNSAAGRIDRLAARLKAG
jgi:cell division protein ZapA